MHKKLIFAAVSVICLGMGTAWAQITSVTADQAPPIAHAGHDYIKLFNETVAPASGAVDIHIDFGVPPGRGITVPFGISYNSNSARHSGVLDNVGYLSQGGWQYGVPMLQYSTSVLPILGTPGNGIVGWCDTVSHYMFTDMEGTTHPLGINQSPESWQFCSGLSWPAPKVQSTDGVLTATTTPMGSAVGPNPVSPPVTVFDHDGQMYYFSNGNGHLHTANKYYSFTVDGTTHTGTGGNGNLAVPNGFPDFIEDRNGNKVIFTSDEQPTTYDVGAFHVTDDLGRTAFAVSSFGSPVGDTVSVSGFSQPYTLTWGAASFNFTINGSLIAPSLPQFWTCAVAIGGGAGSSQVVTAITLPNGLSYQFQYDNPNNENPYGLLRKVIYPNGAYVRYVWGLNPTSAWEISSPVNTPPSGPNTSPPPTNYVCEAIFDTPAISKRFVSFDGVHEVEEQDFTYSTTWTFPNIDPDIAGYKTWTQKQTTVTTTDLVTNVVSKTVYTYAPLPDLAGGNAPGVPSQLAPTHPGEVALQFEDGGGKVLESVKKHYTAEYLPPDVLTTLDNGQSSYTHTVYSPLIGGFLVNVVSDVFEYDFGAEADANAPGPHGPLLRHVHADYNHAFPMNPLMPAANPFTSAIIDRPSAVITYDGSGNRVAEVDTNYDETLVASASATGHDDQNFGTGFINGRGNATTKIAKCFVGTQACAPGDSVTKYAYDQTGQQVSRIDPNGNLVRYSFADSFFDMTPPTNAQSPSGSTNAFLTQITAPQTNNVNHIRNFSYAFSDGALTLAKDENGGSTTYVYNDSLRRPTETDYPDNGQTTVAYNDSGTNPTVVTTKKITAALSVVSTAVLDGMGHTIQAQNNSDPLGVDYSDTQYDGFGRPISVSNPHRSTISPTDGVTQTVYDGLGRVIQITKQDGSVSGTSYFGNCSIASDETGKRRRQCNDALGRLMEVDEPTPGVSETTAATAATANISLSGLLQSKVLSNPATGTVSIAGTDSIVPGTNAYDFGMVTVFVGNASVNHSYGNNGSSPTSASDLAAALCSAINSTSSTSTQVSCTVNSATMTLTAQASGAAGNGITLGVSAQTQFPQSNQSAFGGSITSGTLSGGGATLYDSGITTITVSAFGDNTTWSGSGTTSSSIATNLAAAINGDPSALVIANVSGNAVSLTAKAVGLGGNLPLVCSSTYNSSQFSSPSFSISCPSALSGGKESGGLSSPMTTLYTYDALGNLLKITQQGGTTDQSQWRVRTFSYDSLSRLLTATNPESGNVTMVYDPNGNVLQRISPAPNQTGTATQMISYCYDALNRVTGKAYSAQPCTNGQLPNGTAVVTYVYDQGTNAIGGLSSLVDQAGSGSYTYYPMGRIASEQRIIAGITKSMGYTYNLDGSIATATYPSSAVITYTPDPAGRIGRMQDLDNNINYVVGSGGIGTFANYGPDDSLTGFLEGASSGFAGITNSFSFNNRLQPVNMAAVLPNAISATATVPISGPLQSKLIPGHGAIQATGMLDVLGCSGCDSATVTVTIGGFSATAAGTTADDLASQLIDSLNAASSPVTAAPPQDCCLPPPGTARIVITYKVAGSGGNVTVGCGPSTLCSGITLSGGTDAVPNTTVYDSGSASLTVGSFSVTVPFGQSTNSTAGQVATALAGAINVTASPATAAVNGATLNLARKTGGNITAAVSALSTSHDQPNNFPNPSFTSTATSFGGGASATVFSLNYDFHAGNSDNGIVFAVNNNRDTSRNQTFAYDSLNRLTSAQNAGTDCNQKPLNPNQTKFWGNSYTYDSWGNLLQKIVTKCNAEYLVATADVQNRIHVSPLTTVMTRQGT